MPYSVHIPESITSCVYKMWYGDKYIIVKCKNLPISATKLVAGLNSFIKNTLHGRDIENLAYKFFNYILWNQGESLFIEIIYKSSSPYDLLKQEQKELWKSMGDPNCMNMVFDAYIPIYTQSNTRKSWINRGYYLNFCMWKKKHAPTIQTTA